MELLCLDLEGVLIPEIWINFAERTGIDELRATTRDIPDYDELMKMRLGILDQHGYGLPDIQKVIDTLDPLDGAVEWRQMGVFFNRDVTISHHSSVSAFLPFGREPPEPWSNPVRSASSLASSPLAGGVASRWVVMLCFLYVGNGGGRAAEVGSCSCGPPRSWH